MQSTAYPKKSVVFNLYTTQHSTIESGHSQPPKAISNTSEMIFGAMLLFIYKLTRIFYEKLLSLCQN